jgi:hypothetical protein
MKLQNELPKQLFAATIFFLLLGLASCKSLNPALNPALLPIPEANSSVNVPLIIPSSTLSNLINQRIPPILFEEKGMDLGNGIIGDLSFSRNGMVVVSALDSQTMEVKLPIRIRGEVGLKPGGLRNLFQSKIPIDQIFSPVFRINPEINPNWTIGITQFEMIELGGKLSFNVLGMELDLSNLVQNEIRSWAAANLTSKPDLINLKPFVEESWNQVGKPIKIELEGRKIFASIQPNSVKIKEFFDAEKNYQLWLGLDGKVNTHPEHAVPSRAFPLPNLTENTDQSNQLEIRIPLDITYLELDDLLRQNFGNQSIRVNKKTVFTPKNFRTRAFGEMLGITMDFSAIQTNGKVIEGELFLIGKPQYDDTDQSLKFSNLNFNLKSNNPSAQTAISFKKASIIRQMEKKLNFPLGSSIEESMAGINERLSLQTPIADLKVINLKVLPEGFYPTATGLSIFMKAEGNVLVEWK